jgi:hypothetical protein
MEVDESKQDDVINVENSDSEVEINFSKSSMSTSFMLKSTLKTSKKRDASSPSSSSTSSSGSEVRRSPGEITQLFCESNLIFLSYVLHISYDIL